MQFLLDYRDENDRPYRLEDIPKMLIFFSHALVENTGFATTHFVYNMAGYPNVRARLYEEQQQVIAKHGTAFSTEALEDMKYMDACLRETLRANTHPLGTARKAMQDHTFSNGLSIPAGRKCMIHTYVVNRNADVYDNADEYNPDRIAGQPRTHSTSLGPDYVTFGLGRHACPGRHFLSAQMKMFMSVILRRYDFATKSGQRPKSKTQDGYFVPAEEPITFMPRGV
ncbi:cytochrome P450 [Thamnocephalis sphaerospora]|uniref:Cytochrome P450 n=1 Tax=Thamnocephalis sphaerospora TaxID=78915 RepID=A0A4P9XGJ3_9FUNG|nr:cytochrome P450 [Thamnocephalis sphaerospora]|eukprot:RKP04754.1 cytochrome P450 [Thamnocephalis sphaerospora]